jgi:hypothetical protein
MILHMCFEEQRLKNAAAFRNILTFRSLSSTLTLALNFAFHMLLNGWMENLVVNLFGWQLISVALWTSHVLGSLLFDLLRKICTRMKALEYMIVYTIALSCMLF